MANAITSNGLTTVTQADLVAQMTAALKAIYGADINLDPSTPDAQLMNIFIQATVDNLELITQVYNSFDPDLALGRVLDQRVTLNGIQRQAGTYTTTNITVVTASACILYGLDQNTQPTYTVADSVGNQWNLVTTSTISGAATTVLQFQSATPGAVLTTPNTIIVPVTIVLGVTSVNNPTTYTVLGLNEETDAALKIRRLKSVSLASQGFLSSLLPAIENVSGVTSAYIYENNTDTTTVPDGVPGHSIWVIVDGSPADKDIATAIYQKRNAGCGMYGFKSYAVPQIDSTSFLVKWDQVSTQQLYIKFKTDPLNPAIPVNTALIGTQLPLKLVPLVYEQVNINDLATLIQEIDNNCLATFPSGCGFSTSATGTFSSTLYPDNKYNKFVTSTGNIQFI